MATYFLVFIDYPFNTSEKAPSPFLAIRLYSSINETYCA